MEKFSVELSSNFRRIFVAVPRPPPTVAPRGAPRPPPEALPLGLGLLPSRGRCARTQSKRSWRAELARACSAAISGGSLRGAPLPLLSFPSLSATPNPLRARLRSECDLEVRRNLLKLQRRPRGTDFFFQIFALLTGGMRQFSGMERPKSANSLRRSAPLIMAVQET